MHFTFFLGADHDMAERKLRDVLNSGRVLSDDESVADCATTLHFGREECQEALDLGVEEGNATRQSIFTLIAESMILSQEEVSEALCYALFEDGSLNPDVKIVSCIRK